MISICRYSLNLILHVSNTALEKLCYRLIKKTQMRGARKIDPSTSAQDRLPTRSRNRMLEGVNASFHYSTNPLFQSLVRWSETIERNEAGKSFSSACRKDGDLWPFA